MTMRIVAIGVSLITLSIEVALAQSTTSPPRVFSTLPPTSDKIIVEHAYYFEIRRYEPAVEVTAIPREKAVYENPEMAAIAGISAMASGDFEWFRSTWDEASQVVLETRDREMGQDRAFWIRAWERGFSNRRIYLAARIETGEYVLIEYRLQAQGEKDIELVIPMKSNNGKWLATQELSADPVLLYWKTPTFRPKRVMRAARPIQRQARPED